MRITSSFTHTGSVVLIRFVTSKSLRRNCMRLFVCNYLVLLGFFSGWQPLRISALEPKSPPPPSCAAVHTDYPKDRSGRRVFKTLKDLPLVPITLESAKEIKR